MIWPRCSLELGTFFFVSSGTLRHRSGGRGGHPAHPGCAGQALNSNRGLVTVERRERHGAIRYSPGNGNRSSAHRYTQSPSRTSVHTHARLTVILPDTHAHTAYMHAQLTCAHSSHAHTAHMHVHSSFHSLSPLPLTLALTLTLRSRAVAMSQCLLRFGFGSSFNSRSAAFWGAGSAPSSPPYFSG